MRITKYYCDNCKKETGNLTEVEVKAHDMKQLYPTRRAEICEECFGKFWAGVRSAIEETCTFDERPFINSKERLTTYICSACGKNTYSWQTPEFCSRCGAKSTKKDEETEYEREKR